MNLGREGMAGGGERGGGLKDLDIIAGVGDLRAQGSPLTADSVT